MLILNLSGGLGNQMFQYAFARMLAERYNTPIYLELEAFARQPASRPFALDIFQISTGVRFVHELKQPRNIRQVITLEEAQFHYDEEAVHVLNNEIVEDTAVIIKGYWQSYRYITPVREIILREFMFKNPLPLKWETMAARIKESNAVMVNVRRGEYLKLLHFHGVVSADYIRQGMDICRKRIEKPVFYVFSDDIPWCRENIPQNEHVVFVDEQYYDYKFQYYMQLMVSCRYFIIANSSFAWWAAYLATAPDKIVIYPEKWVTTPELDTRDLCPAEWIKL